MNNTKRLLSLILTAVLIVSCLSVGVPVFSASPSTKTVEVYAGETYNLEFSEDNCYGIQCNVRYDNEGLFSSIEPWSNNNGRKMKNMFVLYGSQPENYAAYLKVAIKADAPVGSRCTVTFYDCIRSDDALGNGPEGYQKSVTVVVAAKPVPPTSSSSTSSTTSSSTTSTTTKAPTVTTKAPTTTTKAPAKGLDFKALNEQIAAAEALKAEEFTATSWANMEAALKIAKDALGAKKQADIDSATDALKIAIAALVPASTDSAAALKEMVEEVKKYEEDSKVIASYKALSEALQNAEAALASENKEEIEAAAAKLKAAFEAFKKEISSLTKTETIEVEKPGEPEGPFCNVRVHKIWLILLIISFILNLLFIALIVYYFINRDKMNKEKVEKPAPAASKTSDDDSVIM